MPNKGCYLDVFGHTLTPIPTVINKKKKPKKIYTCNKNKTQKNLNKKKKKKKNTTMILRGELKTVYGIFFLKKDLKKQKKWSDKKK